MRNLLLNHHAVLVSMLLAVLALFALRPVHPQTLLYPAVRAVVEMKMEFESRNLDRYETEHFVIRYREQDAGTVPMIAQAAEKAYQPVGNTLGYFPRGKTLIVVYPDKAELRKAFGWSGDESAMGVYWGGVIQLLSPNVWLKDSKSTEEFIHSGPMVHEYTHLVFDHIANGNYPRWFTEGLAQYVELRVNGYEWIVPENRLTRPLYSMSELDNHFDDLSNQALAYRESLAAIRYIADVKGEDKLRGVINALKAGQTIQQAISSVLGMDYAAFDAAWREWAIVNMKNDAN